jgi:uncharacterized surface protein with fasciclin (FAS1) repeats
LLKNTTALKNILLYHVVSGKTVYSKYLRCSGLLRMANGKNSRTVCQTKIFQKGARNARDKMPQIIQPDLCASNGVIHVINQVMLP